MPRERPCACVAGHEGMGSSSTVSWAACGHTRLQGPVAPGSKDLTSCVWCWVQGTGTAGLCGSWSQVRLACARPLPSLLLS